MTVKTICVCGAGTMGSGIAQVSAQAGFATIQFDINLEMLDKSRHSIEKKLQSQVDKGRMTDDAKMKALDLIVFTNNINDCVADVIIEAIAEIEEAKIDLFNKLAAVNSSRTIFATNTSSLSINDIAAKTKHPSQVVGMHFFNPAYAMKLVEVVVGKHTSEKVSQSICDLARQMDKTPVLCKDAPGFIVNHVARPYYLEALRLVETGAATIETIDEIMEASGFKMGPFKLMDLIGMDINYNVANIVYEALGKPARLQPSALQKQKVVEGALGRKSAQGFYKY